MSISSVERIVNIIWPILSQHYAPEIVWPGIAEWNNLRGIWPDMPSIVACIDGTSHIIFRPNTEPQAEFYSGHRSFHCFHTVVIITNNNKFTYIGAGYLGHNNDQRCFNMMPEIGPGLDLDFPPDAYMLADMGYVNQYPIVAPYRQFEINQNPNLHRAINLAIHKRRIYVEHLIKHLKNYKIFI